jgi:HNH endonuclease
MVARHDYVHMRTVDERFWDKVEPEPMSGCWLWTGSADHRGYGRFAITSKKFVYPHRYAYEATVGTIADGLVIDHKCRNPYCCNPDHLDVVRQKENIRRGNLSDANKSRFAAITHCPQGHEYTPENTSISVSKKGYKNRSCKACNTEKARRYRAKSCKTEPQ